jgi:hypothetical protein
MKLSHLEQHYIFESLGFEKHDPYVEYWKKEVHPLLLEVALSPEQVKQLFKSIETTASEQGSNRTAAGKAVDKASEISEKVKDLWFNKLGGALQQSGPVKAFDEKYEKIKAKVAAENPKLAQALGKYKQFADNNPKLQKFLLMIAASIAGALGLAVAGGAAAGIAATGLGVGAGVAIVNIVDRLLKGEKASTAIGRGATAGIVAGLTAAGAKAAGDLISAGAEMIKSEENILYWGDKAFNITPEDGERLRDAFKAYTDASPSGNPAELMGAINSPESAEYFGLVRELANKAVSDPEYIQAAFDSAVGIASKNFSINDMVVGAQSVLQAVTPVAAAAAGQTAGAAGEKKESYYVQTRPLSEGQVYLLLKKVSEQQQLTEGPMDLLKKGAGAVAGAVGKGLGAVGKQITTNATYPKLLAAWKLEGSPTDSEDIKRFLQNYGGITPEVIDKVYADMKLGGSEAVQPKADIENIKSLISKLNTSDRQKVISHLEKSVGTA